MTYPVDLGETYVTPNTTDKLNNPSHTARHQAEATEIQALKEKVGIDSSAVATSHDYKLETSATHIANTSNPHSVTKAQVSLGNVDDTSDATKNSATATLTNKTLTAPIVSDFTNATHGHTGASSGGLLTPAYYSGDIGNSTAAGYKTLGPNTEMYDGVTKTNSTTITIVTKGIYYIHAQQLINAGGSPGYFCIRINNVSIVFGYYLASVMEDITCSCLRSLNVNDTVGVYLTNAVSSTWAGEHSRFDLMLIRQT